MLGELEFYVERISFKTQDELVKMLRVMAIPGLAEAEKSSLQTAIALAEKLTPEEFAVLKEIGK